MEETGRLHAIDSLRGLVAVLMVCYHLAYDLYFFGALPREWMYHPAMNALQLFIGGGFILLAGVSSRYSRSNKKRGLRLFGVAVGISLVTAWMGNPILFGVLHFLSISMVFYGVTARFWDRLPPPAALLLYGVCFLAGSQIYRLNPVQATWLFPLGLLPPGFYSSDYYPLLPWLFLFLAGTCLGGLLRAGRGPVWLRERRPGPLAYVGRHALAIYIVHQPVLYGIVALVSGGWAG